MDYICTGIIINSETFPYICPDCKSMIECDVSFNGFCICKWCEPEFYRGIKKKIDETKF